jgi:hypothetical protein
MFSVADLFSQYQSYATYNAELGRKHVLADDGLISQT